MISGEQQRPLRDTFLVALNGHAFVSGNNRALPQLTTIILFHFEMSIGVKLTKTLFSSYLLPFQPRYLHCLLDQFVDLGRRDFSSKALPCP